MTPTNCPSAHVATRRHSARYRTAWLLVWISSVVPAARGQDVLPPAPEAAAADIERKVQATEHLLGDRPIGQLQATLAEHHEMVPENLARETLHEIAGLPQPGGLGRGWCLEPFIWEASAVRHLPTYFEEPNLERLGYYYGCPYDGSTRYVLFGTWTEYFATQHDDSPLKQAWFETKCELDECQPQNPLLQPVVSAANFYGRVAALPYLMGTWCPTEEVYSLGEDRPGSPVPYRKYYMPLSVKGAFFQAASVTGLAFIIP